MGGGEDFMHILPTLMAVCSSEANLFNTSSLVFTRQ